jgi:hypothetical protein
MSEADYDPATAGAGVAGPSAETWLETALAAGREPTISTAQETTVQ